MDPALAAFLSIVGGFLAGSGGFWVYLRGKYQKRDDRKDCLDKLLMGLAHDKIMYLSILYLEKGWVNEDEYSDLFKYFWEPYCKLGGNGSADRVIKLVQMLPLKPEQRQYPEIRKIADGLEEGAERVIRKVQEGDNRFERGQ